MDILAGGRRADGVVVGSIRARHGGGGGAWRADCELDLPSYNESDSMIDMSIAIISPKEKCERLRKVHRG